MWWLKFQNNKKNISNRWKEFFSKLHEFDWEEIDQLQNFQHSKHVQDFDENQYCLDSKRIKTKSFDSKGRKTAQTSNL